METFKAFGDNASGQQNGPDSTASKPTEQPSAVKTSVNNAQTHERLEQSPTRDQSLLTPHPTKGEVSPASPLYPALSNNPVDVPSGDKTSDDNEDDVDLSKSFQRALSPHADLAKRNKGAVVTKVGEEGVVKMHKFQIYETMNYYYIVGSDLLDTACRILKIDRTAEVGQLNITEDDIVYTSQETNQILRAINEGNKATGGMTLKDVCWGILGFIKFTSQYYMIYVSKRSQVAMVGGHYIYGIDKTEMMPLMTHAAAKVKTDKFIDESRYVGILNNVDLSKCFYFSYSYDVSRTLQHNIMRERRALQDGLPPADHFDHNDMFVWNHHLLEPAKVALRNPYDWCLSIIHGYIDQSALSVYWGRVVYLTIIARRSRFFAGARFLKRGANDLGYVANDVETEQIVSEMLTTSFHAPGPQLFSNPKYTSYVQHRGSIPLHWTQDSSGVSPKPDIHLNVVDPFFSAAALHFDNLLGRYGGPIYCLNLIKTKERVPRETKLLKEYETAVEYLNQFLPEGKKILYHAWDMSRASKSRDQNVIGTLEAIADDVIPKTGIFQNGNDEASGLRLQSGVVRTNCIDCLDRTNAAQSVIAKRVFGHQLQALGVIEEGTTVEYDSDASNIFTHMWHDHGDTIAMQYGGSHLVNTMSTYRKINQWSSQSRDIVETFKRYYNNSFMDSQRQEAYNLFLGNHVFQEGRPMLWELATDYYLHHADPRSMFGKRRPSYRHWYTDEHLDGPSIPPSIWPSDLSDRPLQYFDDYWVEYYRPKTLLTLNRLFPYKMRSTIRYIPVSATQDGKYDLSPFKVRNTELDHQGRDKNPKKAKGVKIVTPSDDSAFMNDLVNSSSIDTLLPSPPLSAKAPKPASLGPWLDAQNQLYGPNRKYTGIIKESSFEAVQQSRPPHVPQLPQHQTNTTTTSNNTAPVTPKELTKAEIAQAAFTALVYSSFHPSVAESDEYARYVAHPANMTLTTDEPDLMKEGQFGFTKTPREFIEYLSKTQSSASTKILNYAEPGSGAIGLTLDERAETSLDEYAEYVESGGRDEPLTVTDEDGGKKRYKAYKQWLRGKSLFKQRPLVGEVS